MVRNARLGSTSRPRVGLAPQRLRAAVGALAAVVFSVTSAPAAESPFAGRWAFTLPDGRAGWLGVEDGKAGLSARLLWGAGSPTAVDEATVVDGVLRLVRKIPSKRESPTLRLEAVRKGANLEMTALVQGGDGAELERGRMTARRIADLPPPPDLAKLRFGEPVRLLPAAGLAGWERVEPEAYDGWKVEGGVLSNRVAGVKGKRGANLRTRDRFEDFRLTTEVRPLDGGNSGIFLRGVYEIQVADSHGKPLDVHHMGALYGRVAPAAEAAKPAGEWQTLEILLVDRHVTVVHNGTKVVDNAPALGCTGGALSSDEFQPGPLVLQGDHSDVDYRNMVLYPVKK